MCLIIAPGKDGKVALLPRSVFDHVLSRNDDGFGAMWAEDGRVKHFKTIGLTADQIYSTMEEYVERFPNVIFHMRYKTHGKIIAGLSHPFRILHKNRHGKDLFFMHNGVLGQFGDDLKYGQSDTTVFKDKILTPLLTRDPDALEDIEVLAAINKLTSGSRLVFMDSDGKVTFTQASTWNQRYGLLLSNEYMLPVEYKTYVNPNSTVSSTTNENKPTGQFVHYRKIVWASGGAPMGNWCSIPAKGYLRTESGALLRDHGPNMAVYAVLDRIKKEDEYLYLTSSNIITIGTPPSNNVVSIVPFADDDAPFADEEEEEEAVERSKGPAPVEQRLRYGRLVHNLYGGTATDTKQLIGDLISAGNEELGAFIVEDAGNAHAVITDLLNLVLSFNDELFKKDPLNPMIFAADDLLEAGDINYHQQAMQNITNLRREEYKRQLEIRKTKAAKEAA